MCFCQGVNSPSEAQANDKDGEAQENDEDGEAGGRLCTEWITQTL